HRVDAQLAGPVGAEVDALAERPVFRRRALPRRHVGVNVSAVVDTYHRDPIGADVAVGELNVVLHREPALARAGQFGGESERAPGLANGVDGETDRRRRLGPASAEFDLRPARGD